MPSRAERMITLAFLAVGYVSIVPFGFVLIVQSYFWTCMRGAPSWTAGAIIGLYLLSCYSRSWNSERSHGQRIAMWATTFMLNALPMAFPKLYGYAPEDYALLFPKMTAWSRTTDAYEINDTLVTGIMLLWMPLAALLSLSLVVVHFSHLRSSSAIKTLPPLPGS